MEDIVPKLIEKVTKTFRGLYEKSAKIQTLVKAMEAGTATYADVQAYSLEVSRLIGKAYEAHISSANLPDGKMYYNIASRLIPQTLDENHSLVAQYAAKVQKAMNRKAGIGLKAQTADREQDRVDGLIELAASGETYDDVAGKLLTAFETYSLSIVDASVKKNADFQYDSGLTPRIIRTSTGKCCDWCRAQVGKYSYPDVPRDVWRRHANCRCLVEYDPADGKRKRQNVHTKKWTDSSGRDMLEARRTVGVSSLVHDLAQHPKRLASFTPAKLLVALEAEGFEVKPLKQGSLKGIPFEKGGGFKVNFEDGGLFQYHPETGSHHGGAYYKISTGKGGIKHYDTDGNEIPNRGS